MRWLAALVGVIAFAPIAIADNPVQVGQYNLPGKPELVQLVTWNDFNESTCFEPTVQRHFEYIDAVEQWWGEKTGRPVDLKDNRTPFEEYKRTCSQDERAELP